MTDRDVLDRVQEELRAIRDERREQFEMLESFIRLTGPDSILGPLPAPDDESTEMLRLFARLLAVKESR